MSAPDMPPPQPNAEPLHWRWRVLLFGLWAIAVLVPIVWLDVWDQVALGSWSLAYWLLAQGVLVCMVLLTAVYAWAANRSERQQHNAPNHNIRDNNCDNDRNHDSICN